MAWLPYLVVVPYSNSTVVESQLGLAVPFNEAEMEVISLGELVVTDGTTTVLVYVLVGRSRYAAGNSWDFVLFD